MSKLFTALISQKTQCDMFWPEPAHPPIKVIRRSAANLQQWPSQAVRPPHSCVRDMSGEPESSNFLHTCQLKLKDELMGFWL